MKRSFFTACYTSIALLIMVSGCEGNYTPKPHGYFRFDLPEKHYRVFDTTYPYKFEYPVYGEVTMPQNVGAAEPYWINIVIPKYNATIYVSYKKVTGNLPVLFEDTYQLVYKHTVKADAITDQPFVNTDKHVYGFLYELSGNTATAVQFYVTDSIRNFIRGSLYFYAEPNKDSLFPLINYFKEDIQHIMETLQWK
jgi:gliding motility-associated lipoprotein GldD